MSALRDVWQREVNGIARRYVRTMDVHGEGLAAALGAVASGADLEVVAEALGWKDGEPPRQVQLPTPEEVSKFGGSR